MASFLKVHFFATEMGTEPVRDWLRELPPIDRKTIGEDIKTVQFGWPLGMPLVRHLGDGIWEIRVRLENRIARILFCLEGNAMVLLSGFIKKQQGTPKPEIDIAKNRMTSMKRRT